MCYVPGLVFDKPIVGLFDFQYPVSTTTNMMTTEYPIITEVPESTQSTSTPPSVYDWEVVDGWFAEYPISIGMNRSFIFDQFAFWYKNSNFRFASKHQAFDVCVKAEDCGGISKNNDGTWECRAWEFVQERGAVSYAKPENFHTRL